MDVLRTTGYHPRPPFLVAREQGFFAREGLEIDFHVTSYAPDHNAGMAVGKWDFTLSSADTMMARVDGDGTDYVLFMQGERGLDAHLVGAPGIARVADLRGTLLAGDPGDSNLDVVRLKIMRDNGIGDDEYQVQIIGSSPVRLEALLRGEVAAAMLPPPHDTTAVQAGCQRLAAANDYVRDYPLMCGWTLRRWAEANRDRLVRFIRAYAQATDWLLEPEHREATLALMQREQTLSREQAELRYSHVVPHAAIDPAGLLRLQTLRIQMGFRRAPYPPVERYYDASYWAEATGRPSPPPAGAPHL